MNSKSNAALAILLAGAAVATAAAQEAAKPTPLSQFHYVGAKTRIGIGVDDDGNARGELYQVLQSSESSATLAELWAAKRSGGGKLSHHWVSGERVDKVFAAFDQSETDVRKATLGGGQEWERLFWNAYLSKGIGKSKLTGASSVATVRTLTGTEGGRPFVQDETTTVTSFAWRKPYDWGVGARVGHFYPAHLLRVTGGLDYDWGKHSARQWTASILAEKFFEGSPLSVALSAETSHREGDFEPRRRDHRGLLMLRYELGGPTSSFRPAKVTRTVTTTERVPDPNWVPPAPPAAAAPPAASTTGAVATASATPAAPAAPTMRTETRIVRSDAKDAQETYFDLGSARLKPAAMKELDALVARIEAQRPYVQLQVTIVGHTCPTGSDRNNFPLSQKRADAVKAYLVSKGVPEAFITTDAKAGKAPKYPEVKGQSFRNRRADTDVVILKERSEQVQVPVAAPAPAASAQRPAPSAPAAASAPAAPTPAPQRPTIERQVTREVVEDAPNPWRARALLNSVPHRTQVDTYGWVQTTTTVTLGEKRFINRPPVAVDDSVTVPCNTTAPTAINVLANDTDPDGDTLNLQSVTAAGKGTAVIAGRVVNYTPTAAACGSTDTFTYTINDGKGQTATARVNITVAAPPPPPVPPNAPPVAVDDRYVVPCNAVDRVFDVLANDRDADGDALTIVSVTQPTAPAITARVAIGSGGRNVIFNGGPACFPSATFTYTISDGKGGTATATVTVIDP